VCARVCVPAFHSVQLGRLLAGLYCMSEYEFVYACVVCVCAYL